MTVEGANLCTDPSTRLEGNTAGDSGCIVAEVVRALACNAPLQNVTVIYIYLETEVELNPQLPESKPLSPVPGRQQS